MAYAHSFIKYIMKGWNFKYYIDYNRFSSFHTRISNTTKTIHYLDIQIQLIIKPYMFKFES